MSHPIRHPKFRAAPPPPQWPSFQGQAQLVGTSRSNVTVWVDPSLGAPGLQNATDLLADADRIVAANNSYFGTLGGAVNVIVFALGGATDGTGGADHMGCDYQTGNAIEVCASFGDSMRVSALFEAELSECSMQGNLCGLSTGEALSRWCAMDVSGNALADFASVPTWVQDGMPDFVNTTDQTDQNYDSIGCGMAFISWLGLKYGLSTVAPAMVKLGNSGTLAGLYAALSGDAATNALTKFMAAVNGLHGGPGTIGSDDPFNVATPLPIPPVPQPVPAPAPTPVPSPPSPQPGPAPVTSGNFTISGTVTLMPVLATA